MVLNHTKAQKDTMAKVEPIRPVKTLRETGKMNPTKLSPLEQEVVRARAEHQMLVMYHRNAVETSWSI